MDEISKVLDEVFNGDIQEPEREKVTTDELRAAYCKAAELKGPATGISEKVRPAFMRREIIIRFLQWMENTASWLLINTEKVTVFTLQDCRIPLRTAVFCFVQFIMQREWNRR